MAWSAGEGWTGCSPFSHLSLSAVCSVLGGSWGKGGLACRVMIYRRVGIWDSRMIWFFFYITVHGEECEVEESSGVAIISWKKKGKESHDVRHHVSSSLARFGGEL